MARDPDVLSKMDVLVLSSLARVPMHGYELKLELRYRHVRWWAKVEHGHLYATLARLEKKGLIEPVEDDTKSSGRARKVYAVTPTGRRRMLDRLEEIGAVPDPSYFELDVFFAGFYLLDRERVLELLSRRVEALLSQAKEARALQAAMEGKIPLAGQLIISHRIDHLDQEVLFAQEAIKTIADAEAWGPMMGQERISDFLERTGARIEDP